MYVKTINPTEKARVCFAGSFNYPCSVRPGELIYYPYVDQTIKSGYVESWRGQREKHKSHRFERFHYEISGTTGLWVCNRYGYSEGGRYWMYLLNNHPYLRPVLGWGPSACSADNTTQLLKNNVVAELYGKANQARFNSAVFVAELGETIKYVSDILSSFIRVTKLFSEAAKRSKNPHSTWLEYRYAIMPLILTVQDALESLNPVRPKEKVQNFERIITRTSEKHDFAYDYGKLGFTSSMITEHRCGAAIEIAFQNDLAPWGTSAYDVLMAGWERVPLSFVVDWWFDVGAWLDSFRDTNLIIADKYATIVKRSTLKIWLNTNACASDMVLKEYPTYQHPFVVSGYNIIRYIDDAVLPPSMPCLQAGSLSLFRKLDALALIIGALLGLRKRS